MEFNDFLNEESSDGKRRRIHNMYPDALKVTLEMLTPSFLLAVGKTTLDPTENRQIVAGVRFVFLQDRESSDFSDVVYKSRETLHIFNRLDNTLRFVRVYLRLKEIPREVTFTNQHEVHINKEMKWTLIFSDVDGEGQTRHDIVLNQEHINLNMTEHDAKYSPHFTGITTLMPNNLGPIEVEAEETNVDDQSIKLIYFRKGERDPWMRKR